MDEKPKFLERSALLIGENSLKKLAQSNILVIGLGGVGSYAVEVLARAGVGKMTLVDGDIVDITNINRQLHALHSTVGKSKSELMVERVLDINPRIDVTGINRFLEPADMEELVTNKFDYVLDCIDSITPKITLITLCKQRKIKFISSMGAGGKTDASKIEIADIYHTRDCFFTRDIRKRLRRMGYNYGIKVVYSPELMEKSTMALTQNTQYKKSYYGTISYMPAMFGMTMASFVIRKLIS